MASNLNKTSGITLHKEKRRRKKKKKMEKKGKVTHSWKKICTSVAPHFLDRTQKQRYAKHNDSHRKKIKPDIKIKMKNKKNIPSSFPEISFRILINQGLQKSEFGNLMQFLWKWIWGGENVRGWGVGGWLRHRNIRTKI